MSKACKYDPVAATDAELGMDIKKGTEAPAIDEGMNTAATGQVSSAWRTAFFVLLGLVIGFGIFCVAMPPPHPHHHKMHHSHHMTDKPAQTDFPWADDDDAASRAHPPQFWPKRNGDFEDAGVEGAAPHEGGDRGWDNERHHRPVKEAWKAWAQRWKNFKEHAEGSRTRGGEHEGKREHEPHKRGHDAHKDEHRSDEHGDDANFGAERPAKPEAPRRAP